MAEIVTTKGSLENHAYESAVQPGLNSKYEEEAQEAADDDSRASEDTAGAIESDQSPGTGTARSA